MKIAEGRRSLWPCRAGTATLGCLLVLGRPLLAADLAAEGGTAPRRAPPDPVLTSLPLEPGLQACLQHLREADLEEQLLCLLRLKEAGSAAAVAIPTLCDILARSDGATDHVLLASILDVLRSLGLGAAPAAETLSSLLSHRCQLYKDRDKMLVVRLRTYILVTLSEIGFPSSALPALLDSLAHVDSRMTASEVGAAARAIRSLGPHGREFAPYLLMTIAERFSEEEFSLDCYEPQFPPHEATTVQLEAVRSLGRVCSSEDWQVLEVLRQLAEDPGHGGMDSRVVREAQSALELILTRHAGTELSQPRR